VSIRPPAFSLGVDVLGVETVLGAVRRVVIVECDAEGGEVAQVLAVHALDELLGREPFLFGAQHDRRAVGVVRAHVVHRVAAHALVAHPDVGLDVAHEVAEVDVAVGVGQGVGDEELAGHDGCGNRCRIKSRV
jgi:hypothetical protein